jgi:hypothetical protein
MEALKKADHFPAKAKRIQRRTRNHAIEPGGRAAAAQDAENRSRVTHQQSDLKVRPFCSQCSLHRPRIEADSAARVRPPISACSCRKQQGQERIHIRIVIQITEASEFIVHFEHSQRYMLLRIPEPSINAFMNRLSLANSTRIPCVSRRTPIFNLLLIPLTLRKASLIKEIRRQPCVPHEEFVAILSGNDYPTHPVDSEFISAAPEMIQQYLSRDLREV